MHIKSLRNLREVSIRIEDSWVLLYDSNEKEKQNAISIPEIKALVYSVSEKSMGILKECGTYINFPKQCLVDIPEVVEQLKKQNQNMIINGN